MRFGILITGAIALSLATAALAKEPETISRRAWVPSAERPQGEVRLVSRSGVPVIEVVLYSRVLRHVVARIREKENANWPEGREGAEASRRYVEALEQSAADVLRAHEPTPAAKGSKAPRAKVGLLIEIDGGAEGGFAAFSDPEVIEKKEGLELRKVRQLRRIDLPGAYVTRNMELIMADSFRD